MDINGCFVGIHDDYEGNFHENLIDGLPDAVVSGGRERTRRVAAFWCILAIGWLALSMAWLSDGRGWRGGYLTITFLPAMM